MDNQHQKIKGYRDLSQEDIDLMNAIKIKGAELETLVAEVNKHLMCQRAKLNMAINPGNEDAERVKKAEPARWAAMARTDLQVGIMKLVRSVAQPTDN